MDTNDMKNKLIERYLYLKDNLEMINILYSDDKEQIRFLEKLEHLLFSNDDLKNNSCYGNIEDLKFYKGLLLDYAYNKYLINRCSYYDGIILETPKYYENKIKYYEDLKEQDLSITKEEFTKRIDLSKILCILYSFILKQEHDIKTRNKKLNILLLYGFLAQKDNSFIFDVDNEWCEQVKDLCNNKNRIKHEKNNKFIRTLCKITKEEMDF